MVLIAYFTCEQTMVGPSGIRGKIFLYVDSSGTVILIGLDCNGGPSWCFYEPTLEISARPESRESRFLLAIANVIDLPIDFL